MKIIGITGSSGAGKTTICTLLEKQYEAEIIDADKIAKELSKKGNMYFNSIVECFGITILDETGELNRKKLATIIYEDNEKRKILNNLTFKYVVKEIKENINKLKGKELVVIDAPLLFESDLDKLCDIVIGIIAKEEDKINRICKRDNIGKDLAIKRLKIQLNDEYLIQNSDYVIYNDGEIENLENEIKNIRI